MICFTKQNLKKDPIKFKEYRKKFSDIKQKWHDETPTYIKTQILTQKTH